MDRKQTQAFEAFVAESSDTLLRMAILLASDPQAAEDVYQETLQRLAARWGRVGQKRGKLSFGPLPTADSDVFDQATITLWNPLPGPALRSALFKVLAATPGMSVNSHATDSQGRPSVEISRVDNPEGEVTAVFENPANAGVNEMTFTQPADGNGSTATQASDVFLSTTRTDTFPGNPYTGG